MSPPVVTDHIYIYIEFVFLF